MRVGSDTKIGSAKAKGDKDIRGDSMDYICPVCKKAFKRDLGVVIPHMEGHIVDVIKKKHPDWAEENGTCHKCYIYYKEQMHPK